jgi:hypothetical protein
LLEDLPVNGVFWLRACVADLCLLLAEAAEAEPGARLCEKSIF